MPTRILLADDHDMVREGLRGLLESRDDFEIVAEARDGREAVELARRHGVDIAILDLWMPNLSGIDAARQILHDTTARVIMLTMHEAWSHVRDALRAGAAAYVVKSAASSQLLAAIDAVREGRSFVSSAVSHHVVEAIRVGSGHRKEPLDVLTRREREVLQLIVDGHSSKEIAAQLALSVKTVDTHRARIMSKLNVHKTSGLVRLAIREGLVAP